MDKIRIIANTFAMKEEMEENFTGVLQVCSGIGLNGIEPMSTFNDEQGGIPMRIWAMETMKKGETFLQQHDMTLSGTHVGVCYGTNVMPTEQIIANIHKMEQAFHLKNYIFSGLFRDEEGAEKWAKILTDVVEGTRDIGANILYHNHECEFCKIVVDGKEQFALDHFLKLTAPEVRLQIDIGWAGLMTDEVEAVKKYADRIQSIHCKDFYPKAKEGYTHTNMPEEYFAPIGEGMIKTREIMGLLEALPLFDGSVVIDMDVLNRGAQADYTTSYNNLVEYLGKENVQEKYKGIVLPGGMKLPEGVTLPDGFVLPEKMNLPEGVDLSSISPEVLKKYIAKEAQKQGLSGKQGKSEGTGSVSPEQLAEAVRQVLCPGSDSGKITRKYLDQLWVEQRLIGSGLADTRLELFGEVFDTPVMTAALSHLDQARRNGAAEMALGAKNAGALHWCGMGDEAELQRIMATGAKVIKIVKPKWENAQVLADIDMAKRCGVLAVGMDIDHAFSRSGGYDKFQGEKYASKTLEDLRSFVSYAGEMPFIVKGVLSVRDALAAQQAGAAGIVLSHHNGRMDYAVPPVQILPEIRKAVGPQMKIFVDCSIQSGMDVYKALALGADGVCVGRHLKKYLDQGGSEAVTGEIVTMTKALCYTMEMTGVRTLHDMDPTVIHLSKTE